MPEHYSFYYLNEAGASITFVSMQCDSDEAAKVWLPQFKPAACVRTEVWSGRRLVTQTNATKISRTIPPTQELRPDH